MWSPNVEKQGATVKKWKRKAASASFAPVSVLLQLLVDEQYGVHLLRVHKPRRREPACTWFRSGGGSFMELLTV